MVTFGGVSSTVIALALITAGIWAFVEVQRLKHKIIALGLISLILFSYFSFYAVFSDNPVDVKSPKGIWDGSKLYFSWLLSVFSNIKTLTANAVNLDWQPDNRTVKSSKG